MIPAATVVMGLAAALGAFVLPSGSTDQPLTWLPPYIVGIAFLLLWWRGLAGEPLVALGHAGPWTRIVRGLAAGFVLGAGIMALVVDAGRELGAWTVSLSERLDWGAMAGWTVVLVVAAYYEELLLRGHVLQELGRRSRGLGVALSSVVFALVHVGNPNAGDGGWVPLALVVANITLAGALLAAAYLHSGDLWLPTGLHFGWNWAQAILFGLPVSGFALPSILHGEMSDPAPAWSGSAFGPESSAPALVIVAAVAGPWLFVVLRRARRLPVEGPAVAPATERRDDTTLDAR